MRAIALIAAAIIALPACLTLKDEARPACDASPRARYTHAPVAGDDGRLLDARQAWDTIYLREGPVANASGFTQSPSGWKPSHIRITGAASPSNISLEQLHLDPGATSGGQVAWTERFDWVEPRCHVTTTEGLTVALGTPKDGEIAVVGKGVWVYTAGFWTNGTLFYTNIEGFDKSAWPRAGWYEWGGGDALQVYVYDQKRDEEPAHWKPVGNPVDGSSVNEGYLTTIQGFNEALKGLSTQTSRVVVIPPEKAYTLPGNEAHPLYGSELVFYLWIVRVVDLPCPQDAVLPFCDAPTP